MNKGIQHIYRSVTVTFLMAGFLAHLLVPFSSQAQKTAFTRWLSYNVVSSGNESELKLRNSIKELPEQNADFWILVKEASELVANHRDHFKIPYSNSGQPDNQPETDWLIEQWNMFQNQKSGFKSVLAESIKILSNWIPQDLGTSYFDGSTGPHQPISQKKISCFPNILSTGILQPLISGISINAP